MGFRAKLSTKANQAVGRVECRWLGQSYLPYEPIKLGELSDKANAGVGRGTGTLSADAPMDEGYLSVM